MVCPPHGGQARSNLPMASILHQPYAATLVGQSKAFQPESLPHELKDFRDYHAGETVLVCGCGSSPSPAVAPERFITIRVNEVGWPFPPQSPVLPHTLHPFTAALICPA